MALAISKNSWHYRLHVIVRAAWGKKPSPNERWSLCPYFHTTLWGSLITFLVIPLVLLGWLCCKSLRIAYKVSNKHRWLSFFADFVDTSPLGSQLDKAAENYKNAPIPESLKWLYIAFAALVLVVAVGSLIALLTVGGFKLVELLPLILQWVWTGLLYTGAFLFEVMGFIGGVLIWSGECIAAAATFLFGLAVSAFKWVFAIVSSERFWSDTIYVLGWYLSAILGSIALAVSSLLLLNSKWARRFYGRYQISANGYMEARKARADALAKALEESLTGTETSPFAPYRQRKVQPEAVADVIVAIILFIPMLTMKTARFSIRSLKSLYSKEVTQFKVVNGQKIKTQVKVLGPIGVIWKFLVGFKKGICPIIEFIDENPQTNPEGTD